MDSLIKLNFNCNKQLKLEHWNNDVKVNMTIGDISYWCNKYLRIVKNIDETSMNSAHKLERFEKLCNDIIIK